MIRDAKARYYKEYVETNKHNSSKLAKLFDKLPGKCKDNSVKSLTCKEKTLVKDKDIAGATSTLPESLRAVPEIILRGWLAADTFLSGGGRVFC